MHVSLALILMVFAFVLFVCAGLNVPSGRISLGWFGLACWVASILVGSS